MSGWRRLRWSSGRRSSTPVADFWQISRTGQDPAIPNLPLETAAGGAEDHPATIAITLGGITVELAGVSEHSATVAAQLAGVSVDVGAVIGHPASVAFVLDYIAAAIGGNSGHAATISAELDGIGLSLDGAVSGGSAAVGAPGSRSKRRYLVAVDDKRFYVPEDQIDEWIRDKEEEVVAVVEKKRGPPKVKRSNVPAIKAPGGDDYLRALVAMSNLRIQTQIEALTRAQYKPMEVDEEDEEIALLMAL